MSFATSRFFKTLSSVPSKTTLISLRSFAKCLAAIDPSCSYRTVRARLKSPVHAKLLSNVTGDCGFEVKHLATLAAVCLAKTDATVKSGLFIEAVALSRGCELAKVVKSNAKAVTAAANNHAAITLAKEAYAKAAKTFTPVYLGDGHKDASDDERAINNATESMTVAIKTAAAYGEDITKVVEFKPYAFRSWIGEIRNVELPSSKPRFERTASELTKEFLHSVCGFMQGVKCGYWGGALPTISMTTILGAMNKVTAYCSDEQKKDLLPVYKDVINLAWQCSYTDSVDSLNFDQARSLAAQIQDRFDDMTAQQREQYELNAREFVAKVLCNENVEPVDCVECMCALNAAEKRINDRLAKEAAASNKAAQSKVANKMAAKAAAKGRVRNVQPCEGIDSTNTPSEPMGFVYEPHKGVYEFEQVDDAGEPIVNAPEFRDCVYVPSTDI